jgi:hypothetical protein
MFTNNLTITIMKQLLFSAVLFLFSLSIFAQATPVTEFRVATAATVFGVNIPVGTKVYNIATKQIWVCTTAAPSTASIGTPGAGAFTLLNPAEQTLSTDGTNTVTLSNGAMIDGVAGSTSSFQIAGGGVNTVGTALGVITVTATETQDLSNTPKPATITVGITGGDATDLPLADGTNAGLLKPADYTKLSNIDPTAIVGTYTVYQKEADAALVAGGVVTLSPAPKATSTSSSVLVSYNGVELNSAAGLYTVDIAAGTVTFVLAKVPISTYDLITVSYLKP